MQITCDKCQTSYQVDDQLIPPEGAPVQCTKCGNLFTAFPPAAPARTPARTVMMFAADPVAPAAVPPVNPPSPANPPPSANPAAQARSMTVPTPQAQPPAAQPYRPPTGSQPVPFGSARTQAFGIPATPPSSRTQPAMPQAPAAQPSPQAAARPPSSSYPVASSPAPAARVPSSAAVPTAPARPASSAAAPAVSGPSAQLDQPLDLSRPGRMTQMFYSEGDAAEETNLRAERGEANRKPGQTGMFSQASDLEKQLRSRNRMALIVILVLLTGAAAAVVFGLYGQAIFGPPGADRQARQDLDAAILIVKKDDLASLQAADKAIGEILARKPLYMAAKADRALVQQFLADSSLWQAERLKASYDALGKQSRQITARNDPSEGQQRAKITDAMKAIDSQYESVGKQAKAYESEGKVLIDEAAKAEPKNPVVLRAQAFLTADHDQADGAQKLARLYLRESGVSKDGWSELALAESDAAGKPSEEKRTEGLTHAKAALALDPGLVRALLMQVRLDAINKKEAETKADAAALTAANPAHAGGTAQLAALEEELTREKIDKDARDAKVAAQAKADAAAEAQAAEESKEAAKDEAKKAQPKAAAKRNR